MLARARRPESAYSNNRYNIPFSMEGCVFYAPLWQEDMRGGGPLTSYDRNRRSLTVTEATWGAKTGRTFDGTNDEITGSFSPVSGLSAFWIGIWFRYTSTATNKIVYSEKVASGGTMLQVAISADAAGKVTFWYSDLTNPTMTISHSGSWNDGVWHFIECARRAANSWDILVDGVSRATATDNLQSPSTPDILAIGRQAETAGGFYAGDVGEVIVFNKNIPAAQGNGMRLATMGRYY